jgi:hypothetical protein
MPAAHSRQNRIVATGVSWSGRGCESSTYDGDQVSDQVSSSPADSANSPRHASFVTDSIGPRSTSASGPATAWISGARGPSSSRVTVRTHGVAEPKSNRSRRSCATATSPLVHLTERTRSAVRVSGSLPIGR